VIVGFGLRSIFMCFCMSFFTDFVFLCICVIYIFSFLSESDCHYESSRLPGKDSSLK